MIPLLVFTLSVFAVTFIIGQSKISLPIRIAVDDGTKASTWRMWILALLECNACLAVWLGAGAFFFHVTPPALATWWISSLYCCASSLLLAKISGLTDP